MTVNRRAGTTTATILTGLILILGLACAALPEWQRLSTLAVWDVGEVRANYRAQFEKRDTLQAQLELLHSQIETVDCLAARLASGTISLAEAVAECEPVVRDRPGFVTVLSLDYKTSSLKLMISRHLISRVSYVLREDTDQLRTTLARLEAECSALNS